MSEKPIDPRTPRQTLDRAKFERNSALYSTYRLVAMLTDTITGIEAALRDLRSNDPIEAESKLDLILLRFSNLSTRDEIYEHTKAIRNLGGVVIVWQPGDMEGFGDPEVSPEDRLEECRRSLEDCEHGYGIIRATLGENTKLEG
jgi:hypothetical protein